MRLLFISLLFAAVLVLTIAASKAGDQPQSYDVKAAFAESDTNADGEIDLAEFHARMVEVFYNADLDKNGSLSPAEYQRLPFSGEFKDADPTGSGRVTLHEFVAVRYRQFVEADSNHDGALSFDEVVAAYEGRKAP